ncbi:hypothetical protein [Nonomuraea sp. NPDC001831]|uniref:hypothetical protein n=1 Tax=Nonomuraea sp. NPDC001831 TaxID=3364340 RepID=UPI0036C0E086
MYILSAAILLVGALCIINLIFTMGVIKRLREHTALLRGSNDPMAIELGTEIGDFTALTIDGEQIDHESLTAETSIAFFSPNCKPCKEKLPGFVAYAAGLPRGRNQVLAVVAGNADMAAGFTAELRQVARVVVEGPSGPLVSAFGVRAFPTVLTVAPNRHGRLEVIANKVDLGQPATVAA